MKIALIALTLATSTPALFSQSVTIDFATDTPGIDFTVGNGSWAGDLYDNSGGFLEIGGLGGADKNGGLMVSFDPIDVTEGFGEFFESRTETEVVQIENPSFDPSRPEGPFNERNSFQTVTLATGRPIGFSMSIRCASGIDDTQTINISLLSSSNGESYDLKPFYADYLSVGQFRTFFQGDRDYAAMNSSLIDWTSVDGLMLSVDQHPGFYVALDYIEFQYSIVPEPRNISVLVGFFLISWMSGRRRRIR